MAYKYELWDGKKVVGYYQTENELSGTHIRIFPRLGDRWLEFTVPLTSRIVSSDYQDHLVRIVLNVKGKEKQQIAFLKTGVFW